MVEAQQPASGLHDRHEQHDAARPGLASVARAAPAVNDRLAVMIDLALDDLAEGYVDLPTVLRVLATAAWQEGRNDALY